MKNTLPLFSFLLLASLGAKCQQDTWDVGLTEALIARNKQEHAERRSLRDNQLFTTLQVQGWKQRQDEFRRLMAAADQRLTSVFILIADVTLVYETAAAFREMFDLQQQSFQIIVRHPQSLLAAYAQQERIMEDATDLLRFGHLVVAGHGELGRMKTASRQAVYRELRDKVQALRLRCKAMHASLQQFDLADALKNQPALAFIARDKAIVDDIIRQFK
jgi:hypothetical protein